ncbi:MAG: hypothetical protein IJF08_02160 [Clostridia bacterium]|nr:hypothetical protein [Clostridia bacterium]
MRKTFYLFLMIFVMVISLAACQELNVPDRSQYEEGSLHTEFVSDNDADNTEDMIVDGAFLKKLNGLQYDSSESSLDPNHSEDISLNTKNYQDDRAEKIVKYTANDIEYEYVYAYSTDGWLYNDGKHWYDGVYNGKPSELVIDAKTGKCIEFSFFPHYSENGEVSYTEEQRYEIAYDFLSKHVEDPQNYKWDPEIGVGISFFWFYRYIGELKTCDHMVIAVDDAGTVFSYSHNNLGDMKNVKPIPEEFMKSVYRVLEEEANSIYRELEEEGCTWTYEAEIDQLVRLEDGSLALDCSVQAKITTKDGNTVSDGAWFIIPITEPTVRAE